MLSQLPLLLADVPHEVQRFDQHRLFYCCCIFGTLLTGNVPCVFRPGELYATASLVGTVLFIVMQQPGCSYALSFSFGVAAVFIVRMAAVCLNWKLPSCRPLFHAQEEGEEGTWPEEQHPHGREAGKH